MKKWCLGAWMSGVVLITVAACGGDKNGNQAPCKTGAEACFCYANDTCDDALTCLAGICLDLQGIGGAPLGQGGQLEVGGAPDLPEGAKASGGSAGQPTTMGGSFTLGGSNGSAGKASGGTSSAGTGSGGTTPVDPFPPDPAGCALVTSCPTCCETTGVYALDALANDATAQYVSAFSVTGASALAEFDFLGADQIGAIFFRFSTAQNIGSLSVQGSGTGGSLEIALVRAQGKDGCIYPVIAGSLSPTPDVCWGLGAGPYALLPADQIEIRVRALQAGRAALNVTGVQYGP
ncbi:MAG TPA: hypothetical protein VHP33_25770 [Polyangiaceae bacterium]|nr:hypothetical protein [Polyangiaceae bacterium]